MSGPTARAERFAAKMQRLAPRIADRFHADYYELLDNDETEDEFGGRTVVETVIESGRCWLKVAGTQGTEGAPWDIVTTTGPYVATLPLDTIAEAHHRIRITAAITGETREFAITAPPRRGGGLELFTRLTLELRDR